MTGSWLAVCARLQVNDFILISDSAYTREHILKMEKAILNRLEWNLTVPTPYVFLVRFAKAASSSDHKNDEEVKEELQTFTYYTTCKFFRCICHFGKAASLCVD